MYFSFAFFTAFKISLVLRLALAKEISLCPAVKFAAFKNLKSSFELMESDSY